MLKTICFLGDSITAAGSWESEIFENARKDKLRLYNCGVGGDTSFCAISRLYSTCLKYNPDMVSLMFGVNDNNCGYYYNKERVEGQLEKERLEAEERFERYKSAMRQLCTLITESGAELVLCTPVPFDNVTPGELERDLSIPLDRATPFIKELAEEFGAYLVDFNGEMKKYMATEQIFCDDRVHPNERGYRLMAQIWSAAMFGGKYATDAQDVLYWCDKIEERREVEKKLSTLMLVEYCFFYGLRMKSDATLAERIETAKERLEKSKEAANEKEIGWYSNYIENIEKKEWLESEYVRLTLEIANGVE